MDKRVDRLKKRELAVSVPASKSILSRALLLAAFTEGETLLRGVRAYGRDGAELIGCLRALGVSVEETDGGLRVLPAPLNRRVSLCVGSGGTSARFLTAMLAFRGGEYALSASPQMTRRPMGLWSVLQAGGAEFDFSGERGHFPFVMRSEGISSPLTVDTDESTQYASGLLLAAAAGNAPFTLRLTGSRTQGSYIRTTLGVLQAFGANAVQSGNTVRVEPSRRETKEFFVPPDVSGACYFYALSLLCGANVLVRDVHQNCNQADLRFLEVLGRRGVTVRDTPEGIVADGSGITGFDGFDLSLKDFSDQTLTLAAMAPFARTPSVLRGIAHIRGQECDRVRAAEENLRALGVPCRSDRENLYIRPAPVRPAVIETYGDHRVAMAFSLVGLKTGGVTILDAECCEKTFGGFFTLIDRLTE